MVAASAVLRGVAAHWHTDPRYWPDEYIYTALSRAIGHGNLDVRGHPTTFYALLQPLLAAPFWQLFPARTAYRLIQLENAVEASLVVVPLWFLCRELRIGRRAAYLACAFSLLVPTLVMIPFTISDWIGYPLAIAGVTVAVRCLNEPSRGGQIAFLSVAGLATLARIQYLALIPAYLAAAVILDGRRAHRRHPWVFVSLLPALAGAALIVTGYYAVDLRPGIATWVLFQAFLLSLTAGVVIVPGAVAAMLRPVGRTEKGFAAFAGIFIVLVLVAASQPAAAEGRYKERYLLALVPLIAVAFGMHLRHARPSRLIALTVGAALIATAARIPLDGYTHRAPLYDSQTFNVAWLLEQHVGAATSALLIALFITGAALFAIAMSMRTRLRVIALPFSVAFALGVTVVATHVEVDHNIRLVDQTWVDEAAHGSPVTAIETPASPKIKFLKQLYWNGSIDRELLLESAVPTDIYATEQLRPGPNGELAGVNGYFLFDRTGTQAVFAGATRVAANGDFVLYRGDRPRFHILAENQLSTKWLSPYARLRAWPIDEEAGSPLVHFTLSLPPTRARRVHVQLGNQIFIVTSGSPLELTCRSRAWPFKLLIVSPEAVPDPLGRPVTVRMTNVTATSSSEPAPVAASCVAAGV